MKLLKTLSLFVILAALIPSLSFGHALWTPKSITPPRSESSSQLKLGPCGGIRNPPTPLARGIKPKIFKPNETINVKWDETIDHTGYFHINLIDVKNQLIKGIMIDMPDSTVDTRVVQKRNMDITIPTLDKNGVAIGDCKECALQLIQEMWPLGKTTRPPGYDPIAFIPATAFYYSCSDIKIESTSTVVPGEVTLDPAKARTNNLDNVVLEWLNPDELNTPNNAAYRILIVMDTTTITAMPTDGTQYTVGQTLGMGTTKVVYDGNLETATIMGLTDTSNLYFKFFTYNVSNLYSMGVESEPGAVVAPVTPIVEITLKQGNVTGTEFDRTKGVITATANVTNAVIDETFSYDWSITNGILMDTTTNKVDAIFEFDPSQPLLDVASYDLTVSATSLLPSSGLTSIDTTVAINIVLPNDTAPVNNDTSNSTSSSGGCSLNVNAKFDPLFLMLMLLSLIAIGLKFRRR